MHTPLHAAKQILRILNRRNVGADETAVTATFVEPFGADGWSGNDFSAGLEHAVEQGWLAIEDGGNLVRLTPVGAVQAIAVAAADAAQPPTG